MATLLAVATGRRLARDFGRQAFDDTVASLRRGRPFSGRLADPLVHLRVVGRLTRWLPPRAMGPCLKRSLILLHLWSRCGLEPTLHLGFAGAAERWQGHAWLTAEHAREILAAGGANGHEEAFLY